MAEKEEKCRGTCNKDYELLLNLFEKVYWKGVLDGRNDSSLFEKALEYFFDNEG